MAIWNWTRDWEEPSRELTKLRREMDRIFDDVGLGSWRTMPDHQHPPVNVHSTEDELVVVVELPGIAASDLDISLAGQTLSIRGERKDNVPEGVTFHHRERGLGRFARLVELPDSVDANKVRTDYANGLLTITLPKAEEAKPKRITVSEK